ncbi:hypothetical protein LJE86_07485 [bacterium BMS3Abin03]|nr:hypothetical protein [bacterium BMS3Abin03]MCG6958715.1 hypothetical protein [bacterium BMS3Abin03]
MKNHALIIVFLLVLVSRSCNVNDLVSEVANGKITAKEKLGEVIKKAKSDFAGDSRLAVIYGRNVSTSGEIDLLGDDLTSNFYYMVQSDSVAAVNPSEANQFYIPVYKSDPIRSPLNINDILSLIKNQNAKDIIGGAFGIIGTVGISTSASYSDSPAALNNVLETNEVKSFRASNVASQIDMYLFPSKSVNDNLGTANSADWIVNFYSSSSSLVYWVKSGSEPIKLSD